MSPFLNILIEDNSGILSPPAATPLLKLILEREYKRGAEIGVWLGLSSKVILDLPSVEKLYMVDPWRYDCQFGTNHSQEALDNAAGIAAKLVSQYGERKEILRMTSSDACWWVSCDLDFVFIDGDHQYESVKNDIKNWRNHVRKGGILCGDDYNLYNLEGGVLTQYTDNPDVKKAVDEAFPGVVKRLPWSYCIGKDSEKGLIEAFMPERFWYVEWEDLWKPR